MDGNRRWAKKHHLLLEKGHEEGARRIEPIVQEAAKRGIRFLTFYSFSTENWKRNAVEIQTLMNLFRVMLHDPVVTRLNQKGVRVNIIGDYYAFPDDIVTRIEEIHEQSKRNSTIITNFALNYGGRDEIVRALRKIGHKHLSDVTEETIASHLDTRDQPDPDLIIRTGGEQRLSNFLTWQSVYSELYFTDVLWPDFTPEEFAKALTWYRNRQRRYGK